MKIALIGDISRPTNMNSGAGTETWTYNYAEALVKKGHEVTLFACKGSDFSGKVIEICEPKDLFSKSLDDYSRRKISLFTIEEVIKVLSKKDEFDIFHVSLFSFYYFLPIIKLLDKPIVITVHGYGDFDRNDLKNIFRKYSSPYYVFPSLSFLENWPKPKRSEVIYHGINLDQFTFSDHPEDYYFWIGGICENKGTGDAVLFAKKSRTKLIIAGTKSDPEYFDKVIKPSLSEKIKYVGQVGLKEKNKYYEKAKATLFTSKINEAFGLVMIESLACGTPVIAYDVDPVKEIITNGICGYIVKTGNVDGVVQASKNISSILRVDCRKNVEEKFSIERMVHQYEKLYSRILTK